MAGSEIKGTSGNDALIGTVDADKISGDRGNDTIDGAGGNDEIDGGDGADIMTGGAGDDKIKGGSGVDLFKFQAGDGKDVITDVAAGETVEISGYASAQSITQVGSSVVVVLSSGDQLTFTGATLAAVQAALKFVDAPTEPQPNFIDGTSGADILIGTSGTDSINGSGGNDEITGAAGDDTVMGGDGIDLFKYRAGDGKDVIVDLAASETVEIKGYTLAQSITQDGSDVVVVLSSSDQITFLNTDVGTVESALQFAPPTPNGQLGYGRPADVQISSDGSRVFVAGEDGYLRVYSADSGELLNSWDVGTKLGGMDISPDGGFAVIVEREPLATYANPAGGYPTYKVAVHKVDLASGAVTNFDYDTSGNDFAFFDVAILGSGDVLLSQSIHPGWSGFATLKLLDLATGQISATSNYLNQNAVLSSSLDGSRVLVAPTNVSDAPLMIYADGAGIVATHENYEDEVAGFNWGVQAFSKEAGLVAQSVGPQIHIYDGQLNYQIDLSAAHPELTAGGVSGLAFDDSGAYLFVLNAGSDTIWQVSTIDWSPIGEIEVGTDIAELTGDFGNRLIVGPDHSYFTVVTDSGLLVVNADSSPVPTEGPDSLTGTAADDVIDGLGGDDVILGLSGDDSLSGGAGNDKLAGGAGADALSGGDGSDTLYSGSYPPPDDPFLGPGPFVFDEGVDADTLEGGAGDDVIHAGFGDNVDGGVGSDDLVISLRGATGATVFDTSGLMAGTPVTVGGGTIQNVEALLYIAGSAYSDAITIATQTKEARVDGADGDDLIVAGASPVVVWGGAGNDRFVSGAAVDYFDGEGGIDTVDYRDATTGVVVVLDQTSGIAPDELWNIENVDGSAYADTLYGSAWANSLRGRGGNDRLAGLAGNDTLEGGEGIDTFEFAAGMGADTIVDFTAGESVNISDYTSLQSITQVGADVVVVLSATDRITFLNADIAAVRAALPLSVSAGPTDGDDNLSGTAGVDNLSGLGGDDTIYGLGGNDTLDGGAGNDTLDGGLGNDTMKGGAGDDHYYRDSSRDVITELSGQGIDTVHTTLAYNLGANIENAILGGTAAANLTGNALANSLTGNSAANTINGGNGNDCLDGGAGADSLVGGSGNDILIIDNAADRITEGARGGVDEVRASVSYSLVAKVEVEQLTASGSAAIDLAGNEFAQTLQGNDAANLLFGAAGNDTLLGGGGDDLLRGGLGIDVLTGGTGFDRFVFEGQAGNDRVTDFVRGEDKIDLDALNISMARVQLTVSGADTLAGIDTSGDGRADFTITIVGETQVNASDFIF